MLDLDFHPTGRHFLQIPGPSPVPDRVLRAMSLPTIDHRGPEFGALGLKVLMGMRDIFKTRHPVMIYAASGTGAWEAALSNTLSPGESAKQKSVLKKWQRAAFAGRARRVKQGRVGILAHPCFTGRSLMR